MALADQIILRGTRAGQPSAASLTPGAIYCVTDEGDILERTTGAAWESFSPTGTGDVTASGTLTANRLLIGGGTTVAAALGSLGTTTTLLHGNAAGAPTFAAVSLTADVLGVLPAANGGTKLVQVVNTQTGAVATGTTLVPVDDTIPQNTEGDEYMTLAVTPTSATNKLRIEVVFNGASGNTTDWVTAALFQDATANALAVSAFFQNGTNEFRPIVFSHTMTAGTTSATTFKVRAGPRDAGATVTFNGVSGGRLFGGVIASSITITEYVP